MEEQLPAITDRDRLQFYSSLRCRRERDDKTPSGTTWGQWFKTKWGETLSDYARRAKAEAIAQRVVEYELATFGRSPAAELIEATKNDRRHDRAAALKKRRKGKAEFEKTLKKAVRRMKKAPKENVR